MNRSLRRISGLGRLEAKDKELEAKDKKLEAKDNFNELEAKDNELRAQNSHVQQQEEKLEESRKQLTTANETNERLLGEKRDADKLLREKEEELALLRAQLHDDDVVVRSRNDERLGQLVERSRDARADAEETGGRDEVEVPQQLHVVIAFFFFLLTLASQKMF